MTPGTDKRCANCGYSVAADWVVCGKCGTPMPEPSMDETEAMFAPTFGLHGKTIRGSMRMGDTYALDFTDGTSLWVTLSTEPELRGDSL